ncbi:MAG TPA: hypothetical protein VHP62_08110, partial [Usitatibacter sp.]|nr:hypothetical protein [Usitatibacter sp.]
MDDAQLEAYEDLALRSDDERLLREGRQAIEQLCEVLRDENSARVEAERQMTSTLVECVKLEERAVSYAMVCACARDLLDALRAVESRRIAGAPAESINRAVNHELRARAILREAL